MDENNAKALLTQKTMSKVLFALTSRPDASQHYPDNLNKTKLRP